MKIVFFREELLKVLQVQKPTVRLNIEIFTEDGEAYVRNDYYGIRTKLHFDSDIQETGSCVYEYKLLLKSLQSFEKKSIITLHDRQVSTNVMAITLDDAQEEFEKIIPLTTVTTYRYILEKSMISDMIKSVIGATDSILMGNPYGGLLEHKNGKFNMVTSNGHMLAISSYEMDLKDFSNFTVPCEVMYIISELLKKNTEGTIIIEQDGQYVQYKIDNSIIHWVMDNNFPNYESILAKDFYYTLTVNRKSLADAAQNIIKVHKKDTPVKISGNLTLETFTEESPIKINIKCKGEVKEPFGINPGYLFKALDSTREDEVTIHIGKVEDPIRFEAGRVTFIIMPIRLNKEK
jgi:DNA polymerase III sliding clamp (beta) subunit (PCNA family)